MTDFYDHNQVRHLVRHGLTVNTSDAYTLWVWAKEGSHVRTTFAGHTFPPTHTRSRSRLFTWARAGRVNLQKGRCTRIDLKADKAADLSPVGAIALSSSRNFNPARSFEVSRVFHTEPAPLPDARLAESRHVHTPCTLRTYPTLEEWEARAAHIRRHILVALGLYPLPEKTPLNPRISGRIEREGYTVEKAYFESLPGFFVCGNLYRPLGQKGPTPGIVCPHGHWKTGRLENSDLGSVPGRCINLARQGHAVFSYDMVGYNDSDQIVHRDFGGPVEDLWGIGAMGLQLWNAIRAVDFLCSLDGVHPDRIGCTGASGGGTQTFMLTAVDDRVKVAAPVNMVSAHMQGGCNCENQGGLRLDVNNVEIASTMAPRPLFLVSASGDWTANTPELEYPAIKDIYRLYNAEDKVASAQVDAPHNYNRESREHIYAWFGKWLLGIHDPKRFRERGFTVEKDRDLLVFHNRKRPARALDAGGLTRALIARSEARLNALRPEDRTSLLHFRKKIGAALKHAIPADCPDTLSVRDMGRAKRDAYIIRRLLLGRQGHGDRIPALLFTPRTHRKRPPATLVVHPGGKAALADLSRGIPGPIVSNLLKRGHLVLAVDTFLTGESSSGQPTRNTDVPYFTTYNPTDAACRVQDILTALACLRSHTEANTCNLLGLGAAGPWCLLARALAPGIARTAGALIAPGRLLVHNTGTRFPLDWLRAAYRAAGAKDALRISEQRLNRSDILNWLSP